ncbi:DUF106 domain-containing protein [Candidatus Woesearchaeota archaeon]|nr:DUF106 domain-containing protein [Candidatus Woesearchaeota archaeon]
MLSSVLNPVLSPLLELPSAVSILLLSLVLNVLIVLVYKIATNQQEMRKLKERMKELQKELKANRTNLEKAQKLQKELMKINGLYMKHSFKSTIYTFLPLIIIFSWMSSHYMFESIKPGSEFQVFISLQHVNESFLNNLKISVLPSSEGLKLVNKTLVNENIVLTMKALNTGRYDLVLELNNDRVVKQVIVSEKQEYAPVVEKFKNSNFKSVKIAQPRLHPFGSFSIFGWHPGWLGTYIISSLVFNSLLRKLLKVY